MAPLLLLLLIAVSASETTNEQDFSERIYQEYSKRCGYSGDVWFDTKTGAIGGSGIDLGAREDETIRLKWTCPQDAHPPIASPTCMPKKFIEEDWTCVSRYGEVKKCANTGDPPCIDGKELEEAERNPCIALNYPRQFYHKHKKAECIDRTIEELKTEIIDLKEQLTALRSGLHLVVDEVF